jgi:hypothetical protein
MGALDDVLDEVEENDAKSGGGLFWNPKKGGAGKYRLRIYRFAEEEVVRSMAIHFAESGAAPVPCLLPADCKYCTTSDALRDAGSREARDQGYAMRRQLNLMFALVLVDDPVEFKVWEATNAQGKNILLCIARAGGWTGKYPKTPEGKEELKECLAKGMPKVCGPKGMDIVVTYAPNEEPKDRYAVDLVMGDGKELPFPEDENVPDPAMVKARRND